ncbi:MAG TPA: hydroxymethylglutaryl-CoA lyase, partial [Chitinophaga sp.]
KTIAASMEEVQTIQELCIKNKKQLVVYISMGFGNPYGDPYNTDIVMQRVSELAALDIPIISLADTVGLADPETITYLFKALVPAYPQVEFGAHFHAAPNQWEEKVRAAWDQGCRRFDSAIRGIGGCPMAKDELVGNIATEHLLDFLAKQRAKPALDKAAWERAYRMAGEVFA